MSTLGSIFTLLFTTHSLLMKNKFLLPVVISYFFWQDVQQNNP